MRMRQSISQFERAFLEETPSTVRARRCARGGAAVRQRQLEHATSADAAVRMLVLVLIATAVIVTVAMFQTLYYVMG